MLGLPRYEPFICICDVLLFSPSLCVCVCVCVYECVYSLLCNIFIEIVSFYGSKFNLFLCDNFHHHFCAQNIFSVQRLDIYAFSFYFVFLILFIFKNFYLFIVDCAGLSLLCAGFL